MTEKFITDRAQYLLKILIERYIREGQPIGSRTLAEDAALPLSPATIRNVLADLEEQGYLTSPHTSAGRVPTPQGYRLFVDNLVTVKPINDYLVQKFKGQLDAEVDVHSLVAMASSFLSDITRLTGIVTLPKRELLTLRHIEFLPLSENRILAILELSDREVQNRIINTNRIYSASELQQAANYLNELFSGQDLPHLRQSLVKAMQEDQLQMNDLMHTAISVADKALASTPDENYVLSGQSHLIDIASAGGVEQLRYLFEAFLEKRDILHLLDQCLNAEGVQIFIGHESGNKLLDSCSIVTAPYTVEGKVLGVMAVVGSTRMEYDRIIPAVDITAKLLSAALNLSHSSPSNS